MDADPLCAFSSPARLLPRKCGLAPASATATATGPPPSNGSVEATVLVRSLKGSAELVKQAKMVLKEHGDIRGLYHDAGVKDRLPANGSKEQQGRRPALDRKRARFNMKDTGSKPVPVVDKSKLVNISDPTAFFMTLDILEEAEEEIKLLNGEAEKRTLNFDPIDKHIRQPGFRGRKSVRSFKAVDDALTEDPIEVPASQTETTESQVSQDVLHADADKNVQSDPSRFGEAFTDVSGKEDLLAAKDGRDDLTDLLISLQALDESEEEEFMRKTIGIKEMRKERVSLRNSIPGLRPLRSNTEQKGSMRVCPSERSLSQTHEDRISELEKHFFPGGGANAKCTDDEPEGSPDIVMGEPSLVRDSSDVLMTEHNFTGSEVDRETPNLDTRAADHVLDPEPDLPDHAHERQPGGSSLGLFRDTEVSKENEECNRNNISVEEDDVPIDYPTIGRSTNENEVSSSIHLESSLVEELVSKQAEDSIRHLEVVKEGGVLHENEVSSSIHLESSLVEELVSKPAEDSIQHLEVVKEGGVLQDKSNQSLEVPLEDIDPLNQPQMHGESTKKLATDLCNALPLTKQKKQQAAQERKRRQQSKRGKKVADESSHAVEIPQANFDLENQPHNDDVNIEKLATDLCNALPLTKQKKQQAAQERKRRQQSKRGKKVADESSHAVEIPQANFDLENQPHNDDVNIEQQAVMSSTLSPNDGKGQKGASTQRRNKTEKLNQRNFLGDVDLAHQPGVRRSTRTRSRPLEFWLGERLLYGPINDDLPAVIGIKAYSPGQDGKKALKVKSLVPEQYSDLVAKSARY